MLLILKTKSLACVFPQAHIQSRVGEEVAETAEREAGGASGTARQLARSVLGAVRPDFESVPEAATLGGGERSNAATARRKACLGKSHHSLPW